MLLPPKQQICKLCYLNIITYSFAVFIDYNTDTPALAGVIN